MNQPTKEEFQTAIKVMEWSLHEMGELNSSWPWWKRQFLELPTDGGYRILSVWKLQLKEVTD